MLNCLIIIFVVHSSSFLTIWPIKWLKIPELLYAAVHLIVAWVWRKSVWYLPWMLSVLSLFTCPYSKTSKEKKRKEKHSSKQNLVHSHWDIHSVKKMGVFWISIPSFMPWLVTKSLIQGNHVLLMSKYFGSKKKRFHWNGINSQAEMVCNRAWMTAFITCEILLSQLSCTLFCVFSEWIWQS